MGGGGRGDPLPPLPPLRQGEGTRGEGGGGHPPPLTPPLRKKMDRGVRISLTPPLWGVLVGGTGKDSIFVLLKLNSTYLEHPRWCISTHLDWWRYGAGT